MDTSVATLRKDYTQQGLREIDLNPDPVQQFKKWLEQAISAQLPEPNAMTIATATTDGKPAARMVLLKDFDDRGFVFYTNYESHKGRQLAQNPQAALVFWWAQLERQVRIEGQVTQVSSQESDEYFHSRPINSQLGAWVSNQSQEVASREVLEQSLVQLQAKYAEQTIPRPAHWGGYRVIPSEIEFWQGRPSRVHDRLLYRRQNDGSWLIKRLSP